MLKNIVRFQLYSIKAQDSIDHAVRLMKDQNIGCVLVTSGDGKPEGIITDRDIVLRCIAEGKSASSCKAADIMTKAPKTVRDTEGLYECIKVMHDAEVRRIPVVDSAGKALGIVSFGDLLKILSKEFNALVENTTHPLESEKTAKKALVA